MSNDNFTEVTTQGWFSRIGGAIKGIFFGLILFIVAFPVLIWNEGRAVDRIKTLEEGSGAVVHIESDAINSVNNQKLVHLTGEAITDEVLEDSAFNVKANAIKLKREVQTYQWKETVKTNTEKQLGGSEKTTKEYSYSKVWSKRLINSNNFKKPEYQNPSSAPFKSLTLIAKEITFGAFDFPASLAQQMSNYQRLELDSINSSKNRRNGSILSYGGGYYAGDDPTNPNIGDQQIHFEFVKPSTISIVAQQTNNTFQSYSTTGGGQILLLAYGVVSQQNMFQTALESNAVFTWLLRILSLIMMTIGIGMILKPLSVLADVLPFLGNVVEAGTGLIAFLIALVLTVITIAIAWLVFRPVIGGVLILIAGFVIWMIKNKVKTNAIKPSVDSASTS